MRQTRAERARRCFIDARFEIEYVRWLDSRLRLQGQALSPYLKTQAKEQARYLVRLGRKLLHTNERVQLPRDLGMHS